MNFQMFKLDLEKTEKPEIKLPTSIGSQEKQESFRKTSTSALLNSLVAQMGLPTMQKTRVRFLGREDTLEKEMATHSSNRAWKIPWMEEPDRLQSMGLQRVGHN